MAQATKKLFLPDGGSFDLPMPAGMTEHVQPRMFGATAAGVPTWLPIVGGAAIGAFVAWLYLQHSR